MKKETTINTFRRLSVKFVQWFDAETRAAEMDTQGPERVDWIRVIPFFLMHVACLGVFFVGFSPLAAWIALGLYVIRMFAITGFYHRYFSHKTFKTSRVFQFVMAFVGSMAVQRGPLWWASHHRHHHKYSDFQEDSHSLKQHGFVWSHVGWFTSKSNFAIRKNYVKELAKYPELRFLDRFDSLIPISLAFVLFGLGVFLERVAPQTGVTGPQLLVWGFFVSTIVLHHATFTINSLAHKFGNRRYETKDDSRNNWFLSIITLGEGWHNNHHHYPNTVRQGFFWWEIDITWYGLKFLELLGIVWDLKGVPAHARANSIANAKMNAGDPS